MANKIISQMPLPKSISHKFAARNVLTAKDALSMNEFELMELLDVGFGEVASAIAQISEIVCPPCQTALQLTEERVRDECLGSRLPTRLRGLDDALCGGIPFGVITELVGPSGIGKTQFCLKIALLAALPTSHGGLNGRVIYVDIENKFSSRRMIEIGAKSLPEIFHKEGMAREMAGRILVLRPTSVSEFTDRGQTGPGWRPWERCQGRPCRRDDGSDAAALPWQRPFTFGCVAVTLGILQQIKLSVLEHQVKLLIIDSMAGLILGDLEGDLKIFKQHPLAWHISFIKSLAEFSQIPVIVTNQVRSQCCEEVQYSFQAISKLEAPSNQERVESRLVASLGIHWAHAVTIRLVLEADSGQRFIKVTKSPISPPLAFPFVITSSGISLISDEGIEVKGLVINTIHGQGCSEIFASAGKSLD
ncbi:hypothetical protein Syun_001151 [Stephania yunnanensis]|uniref:RecA family profile 1 domain-containing protein n=1 Tax=Stephania yunnanensis TaxID=152371 RepID=A0AAP0LDE0_9MAGN